MPVACVDSTERLYVQLPTGPPGSLSVSGVSGSPMVVDGTGDVVGIITIAISESGDIGMAQTSRHIIKMLEELNSRERLAK